MQKRQVYFAHVSWNLSVTLSITAVNKTVNWRNKFTFTAPPCSLNHRNKQGCEAKVTPFLWLTAIRLSVFNIIPSTHQYDTSDIHFSGLIIILWGSCFASFCFMSPVSSVIFLPIYLPSKLFLTLPHKFLVSTLPLFCSFCIFYCTTALLYFTFFLSAFNPGRKLYERDM